MQLSSWAFNLSKLAGISSWQPFLILTQGWVLNPDKISTSSGCSMKVENFGFLLSCWQRGHFVPQHFWHNSCTHAAHLFNSEVGLGNIWQFLQMNLSLEAFIISKTIYFSDLSIFILSNGRSRRAIKCWENNGAESWALLHWAHFGDQRMIFRLDEFYSFQVFNVYNIIFL